MKTHLYSWVTTLILSFAFVLACRVNNPRHRHACRSRSAAAAAFLTPKVRRERSSFLMECNLFFRGRARKDSWRIPETSLQELSQASVTFPQQIDLEYGGKDTKSETPEPKQVVVRNLVPSDLSVVVPMCVREFGTGDTITWKDIPWQDLLENKTTPLEVSDRLFFGPLVKMALEQKIQRQKYGDRPNARPDDNVLCVETNGTVVGIVELSMQPPDAERNPPPVPLPMWIKEVLCIVRGLDRPDGWVTNLLVDESHRGMGYSKVLMKAVEGLARSWGCDFIYLHVDADTVSGRVAQELYRGLDYQPVMDDRPNRKYDWMGPEILSSGLYEVDGVPLLFLRKNLTASV